MPKAGIGSQMSIFYTRARDCDWDWDWYWDCDCDLRLETCDARPRRGVIENRSESTVFRFRNMLAVLEMRARECLDGCRSTVQLPGTAVGHTADGHG